MYSNRIEIILESVLGRKVLHDDPIGYDQSETEIGRSEITHGIFLKQINNLEFYGEAKQYLESLWKYRGPQAKCKLTRKEQHPQTDEWELKGVGYLDFTTRKIKDGKMSIDFVEGGLREILTSQMKEKFELNRETDINGKPISGLITDTLELKGRDIYLLSRLENPTSNFEIKSGEWASTVDIRESFLPLPLTVAANTDPQNIQEPVPHVKSNGSYIFYPKSGAFFLVADRARGKTVLKIKSSMRISYIHTEDYNDSAYMDVRLYRFSGGEDFVIEKETILADIGNPLAVLDQTFTIDRSFVFDGIDSIKEGDSFAVYIRLQGAYGDTSTGNRGHMNVQFDNYTGSIAWSEDSYFEPTTAKCLTAYEAGKRQTEIYTGQPCFESYLLQGKNNAILKNDAHDIVFSNGGWIRNLKKKQEDESLKEWPFEMSFEDFYKSIHSLLPVGYGIATKGNKQYIVLEDLKFFFQRTVAINLGKIDIKERSTAAEYCFQSLKFGYTKGGDYEKPLGLDEYNVQATWASPLTVVDNVYEAIGPSRTDSYGAEDARRMQYSDFPDEDTPYDKDTFMFDVKDIGRSDRGRGQIFSVRTWQDDFEAPPSGVYSPETAYNLNFSPGRNLRRHAYWFNNAIVKLQDLFLQYRNSQGNSELSTKKQGEAVVKENQDTIPIPDLENPLFEPEWIDAEADFSQSVMDQITGTTLIDGREVNNYYCLAEFLNEQNRPERAFIFTVKVKDKFTFKLLKAHGF